MNSTKWAAAHIRRRIKHSGIKANVRVAPGGGAIQVYTHSFDIVFTEDQQREIRSIAKINGFTWVRGMEIIVDQMTNPQQFNFYKGESK